jgi:hypothetical protein
LIDLATCNLRPQCIDQPAGANDQRIAVKAMLTVQPQRELAAHVHPERHVMSIPRRRIGLRELLDDLLAEEELKELGFSDVGGQFDIIEAALTKLIDHERLVVLEDNEIHRSAPG